jgi:hypothetical protein
MSGDRNQDQHDRRNHYRWGEAHVAAYSVNASSKAVRALHKNTLEYV